MILVAIMVCFDVDGTLVDSAYPHFLAVNSVLIKYLKPPIKDLAVFKELNVDYRKFYQEMGIQASIEELNKVFQPTFRLLVEEWMPSLFQNAKEILVYLKERANLFLVTGQKIEIVKLYCRYSQFNFLEFFGWKNVFLTKENDSKESVLKMIRRKEFDENNICVYVSDTPDDLAAAQRAGWKVYGVTTGFSTKENLEKIIIKGNGGVIQDLFELKSMFSREKF